MYKDFKERDLMHEVRSLFAPDRYSAKRMAKPVNFVCIAPEARDGNACEKLL